MNPSCAPIGVFDSGVGGISVLKELYSLMPNENYIYLGDTQNAPYGNKSNEEVYDLSRNCVGNLINKGVKAVVIACNTATSIAADDLREKYSIPIIGIEPAVKPAAQAFPCGKILVMATPVTLRNRKFLDLMKTYESKANIVPLACPGLVEIIEKGKGHDTELRAYLQALFLPYEKYKPDVIVLGCTHYPHIKKQIENSFKTPVSIIDGGYGTARETKRRLLELNLLNDSTSKGTISFVSTSERESEKIIMKEFFETND